MPKATFYKYKFLISTGIQVLNRKIGKTSKI